jgi:regulator of protease activity HflC (stomatin/prohibitin superfamily)
MDFSWLKDLLVTWYEWLLPFTVIDAYEEAVVLRLGKFHRQLGPGFHLIVPFGVERAISDEVVPRVINLSSQSLTTSDGVSAVIGGAVTFSISDIRKAMLEVKTVHQAIADSCCGAIGQAVRGAQWDALTSDAFIKELTSKCREYARKYGLRIERVQLTDLARMRALRLHVDQNNIYKGESESG